NPITKVETAEAIAAALLGLSTLPERKKAPPPSASPPPPPPPPVDCAALRAAVAQAEFAAAGAFEAWSHKTGPEAAWQAAEAAASAARAALAAHPECNPA